MDRPDDFYEELFDVCCELMAAIRNVPQPVVAAVDGIATAAGCQVVAACDLVVATDRSRFATPGVRIGLFCSVPMVPLSRAIGRKRALEMLLTGDPRRRRHRGRVGVGEQGWCPPGSCRRPLPTWPGGSGRFSAGVLAIGKRAFYEQLDRAEPEAYEYTASGHGGQRRHGRCPGGHRGRSSRSARRSGPCRRRRRETRPRCRGVAKRKRRPLVRSASVQPGIVGPSRPVPRHIARPAVCSQRPRGAGTGAHVAGALAGGDRGDAPRRGGRRRDPAHRRPAGLSPGSPPTPSTRSSTPRCSPGVRTPARSGTEPSRNRFARR